MKRELKLGSEVHVAAHPSSSYVLKGSGNILLLYAVDVVSPRGGCCCENVAIQSACTADRMSEHGPKLCIRSGYTSGLLRLPLGNAQSVRPVVTLIRML